MKRSQILGLLLSLMLVRGLIYSAVTPPWQAPDEHEHFEYVSLVSVKSRPVTFEDRSPAVERRIIQSLDRYDFWRFGRISEGAAEILRRGELPQSLADLPKLCCGSHLHQPPVYYMLVAAVISVMPAADAALQLYLVRLMSLLFSLIVVWLTYEATLLLFPDDVFLQIGVPAFVVFLPMFTFMAGVVNNDHIAVLASSIVIYALAVSLRYGVSASRALLVVVGVVGGYYGKRTFLFTAPLVPLAVVLWYAPRWRELPRRAKLALLAGGVLLAAGVPAVVRRDEFTQWASGLYLRLSLGNPLDADGMLAVLRANGALYARWLFESFWGRFGWLNVPLAPFWYALLALVSVSVALGLGIFVYRISKGRSHLAGWQKHILAMYAAAILSIALIVAVSTLATAARMVQYDALFLPQGRYLFPAIIPIATLFVLGLRQLVPEKHRMTGLLAYLAGLVVFDVVCLIRYVVPFFYA